MKVTYKLLIRDDSTFKELTPEEKELWTKFETDDIYRFWIGELDTVPEFHFNWTLIPRQTFQGKFTRAPKPAPAAQPLQAQPPKPATPPSSSSSSISPHSLPTPSTSGT